MFEVNESLSSCNIDELKSILAEQQQVAYDTLQHILSSTKRVKEELLCSLSSIPTHPYQKLKKDYLKETDALLIEDVRLPENFCSFTCAQQISSISETLSNQWDLQVQRLSSENNSNHAETLCNAFTTLSDNISVVDDLKITKHLQFVEMIRNIPIQLIEQQPNEVAQKIVSQYIKNYT